MIERNTFWISILALLQAIQVAAALHWVLSFVPPGSPLSTQVLPEWQYLLKPEWETWIYRGLIISGVVLAVFWNFWLQRTPSLLPLPSFRRLIIVEALLVFVLLSACFKQAVYPHKELATAVLTTGLVLALLNKFCWRAVDRFLPQVGAFLVREPNRPLLRQLLLVGVPIMIVLIIDVPNVTGVVARFFVGEQFHHNDSFLYGPAWGYITGARMNVDIISQYGPGVGVFFGLLSKLFGGLTYESGLRMMLVLSMLYYVTLFFLMRGWLASTAIAAVGILYLLKLQLFHSGVFPFAFTYGSATVVRHWFDIIVLVCLWRHSQRRVLPWLVGAGIACGAQLFYIPSEGVYVTAAFFFYVGLHAWLAGMRRHWGLAALVFVPPAVALALACVFIGPAVTRPQFWQNLGEFVEYFISGFGVTPIVSSLIDRQFLASLMGFVVPLVYITTMLVVGSALLLRRINGRHAFVVMLCVYGLCLYHYYVARSAVTSYYVVSVPYVLVLCFWFKCFVDRLPPPWIDRAKMIGLGLAAWALVTNHNFLSYPNRLNLSRHPLTDLKVAGLLQGTKPYFNHLFREYNPELKMPVNSLGETDEYLVQEADFSSDEALVAYYQQEGGLHKDADLIARLTSPQDAVPVIASFEIKLLMQAQRRPYFYYFPLVISHPMRSRTFVRTSIYTVDQYKKTIARLEADKPPYIFMEKILGMRPLPQYFPYYYSSAVLLTNYVLAHYAPDQEGQYLVAMKRK